MSCYKRVILIIGLLTFLSGCSVYKSSFVCPDAKGANCMSMDMVDKMIASGEIEVYNEAQAPCKGKLCRKYRELKSPTLVSKEAPAVHHKNDEASK